MNKTLTRHSLLKSILLHLLPGWLTGICYFLLVPVVQARGYPSVMALSLAGMIVLIPFELGVILVQKQVTGVRRIRDLIPYRKSLPWWQYLVWVPLIILLSGGLFKAFGFTTGMLQELFRWIPSDRWLDMGLDGGYEKSRLIITYAGFLLLIVLVVPILEEVYFRGYLLPRLPARFGNWNILIHSALFALYHAWSPWMFVVRTLGLLPLIYVVKRKENLCIGIAAHCLLNSLDFFMGLVYIMGM